MARAEQVAASTYAVVLARRQGASHNAAAATAQVGYGGNTDGPIAAILAEVTPASSSHAATAAAHPEPSGHTWERVKDLEPESYDESGNCGPSCMVQ
mmetsp:Transcript_22418/g.56887  ORF Transcript_22418/g.56887 Transcript_22418/m.56887 type:complete len:97 (+) Transcript_22418:345-635(+)